MLTALVELMELYLEEIINLLRLLFEIVGVLVVAYTGCKGLHKCLKKSNDARLYLGRGFELGLQFKLGSEILRTVIIKEWSEIIIVAGLLVLKGMMAFLIHWELKHEKKELERLSQLK